jgi:hypothetical protein
MNAIHGKKRLFRWGSGAILAGFLTGGGIALAATSGGPGSASAGAGVAGGPGSASAGAGVAGGPGSASAGAGVAGGPGGTSGTAQEAATLNSVLGTAASPAAVPAPRVRWALGRLRRLGGVEGSATFHNKTGFHTVAFERGTIQSVAGGHVVVKSPDGTTWTWLIVGDTVVRKNGAKTTTSALSAGESVFAAGPVIGGNRDARLIVIRTGSERTQTSLS